MTRTGSFTAYPHWSSQIKRAASWWYGQNDTHLSIQANITDFYGALAFSGMQGSIPANAVITSATMYMRITGGYHVARAGSNPIVTCIAAVGSIPALPGSHANDGGTLQAGAAIGLSGHNSGNALGGNTQGSTQSIDVRGYIQRIAPASTTVYGYGAGAGAIDYGCILVCSSWLQTTEIWSAADSRKPYIVIAYELNNEAPYAPSVTAPVDTWTYVKGDRTLSIDNPGDIDGDPTTGHIEWAEVSADNQVPGAWNGTPTGDSYVLPSASQTRGKWYAVRGRRQDHHGAWSGYSNTIWFYVNQVPNTPVVTTGMQPIHNLDDLTNDWSGTDYENQAKPTVQVTPSDSDGHDQNRIELKLAATQGGGALHTQNHDGTYASGTSYDFDLNYGLQNDTTYYLSARTRDIYGEYGEWEETAIKVRWADAVYEHNVGASASQPVFSKGTLAGSSPKDAYAFRSATGLAGAGAGAWVSDLDSALGEDYLNIRVRLSIGRDTSTATSLSDMTLDYIGAALQPEKWDFGGADDTEWVLTESERRYGTKALRWTRASATMSPAYAYAETISEDGTDPFVVPVVANTEYTLSLWLKGAANHGDVTGFVRYVGDTFPVTNPLDAVQLTAAATGVMGDWTRLTGTFTTPAGVSKCAIGAQYVSTAATAGDSIIVDAIQLEEGTVATAWNPGATGAVIIDVGGIAVDGEKGGTLRLRTSDGDIIELGSAGLEQDGRLIQPMPAGAMTSFAGASAPTGWLLCDGAAVSRTTYADLFTAIGTTYGVGDGSTTFNVPNMKGRVAVGQDSGDTDFDGLGETGGWKSHDHGTHTHGSHRHSHDGATAINYAYTNVRADIAQATISSAVHNHGLPWSTYTTPTAQGNASASQVQPYRAMPYIIKT